VRPSQCLPSEAETVGIVQPARQTGKSEPVQALWLYGGMWLPLSHSCLTSRLCILIFLTL